MSACNAFIQGDAAYLLTDGAWWDEHGVVDEICTKVISSSRLRLAIGQINSRCVDWYFPAWLEKVKSQEEFLHDLPIAAEAAKSHWQAELGSECHVEFQLFIAMHSETRGKPALFIYSTDRGSFGQLRPGLHEITGVVMPRPDTAKFFNADDLGNPRKFRIGRDAVPLMRAQRALIAPDGHSSVGGFAELTRIDRQGVTSRVVCRWKDKVGEKIAT